MSLAAKKKWYLDYLLIIVGTGLMALAINSVFDASGLVTGGFSAAGKSSLTAGNSSSFVPLIQIQPVSYTKQLSTLLLPALSFSRTRHI